MHLLSFVFFSLVPEGCTKVSNLLEHLCMGEIKDVSWWGRLCEWENAGFSIVCFKMVVPDWMCSGRVAGEKRTVKYLLGLWAYLFCIRNIMAKWHMERKIHGQVKLHGSNGNTRQNNLCKNPSCWYGMRHCIYWTAHVCLLVVEQWNKRVPAASVGAWRRAIISPVCCQSIIFQSTGWGGSLTKLYCFWSRGWWSSFAFRQHSCFW